MEPTRLGDLPAFVVHRIQPGDTPRLAGRFTHVRSTQLGRSWLYDREDPLIGDLVELDGRTHDAVFEAPFWTPSARIQAGSTAPWLDAYWQAWHVTIILDPAAGWQRGPFRATDAQVFELDGRTGISPMGSLPQGATRIRVEPGGWDHEHCQFCMAAISLGDDAFHADGPDYLAYDCWLCVACGEQYAVPRSLAFVWTRADG
jgi:hypothetical protein